MMFLNALVHYAGSTAAAGKALEDLLRRAADTADDACARLAAWATGLAKPERAAGGGAPRGDGTGTGCRALDLPSF